MRTLSSALLAAAAIATRAAGGYDSSWYGSTAHGAAFRSVTDFGAVGDGATDDTLAIQAAIDHDRGSVNAKAPAVVYFPPGTYIVSETLVVWASTVLRGASLARPTIRLAPHAPGFGNASALKPMLATTAGYNQATSYRHWWDNSLASNCIFYNELHLLDLDVSTPGNNGAVGLFWCVAQQTSIRDVRIAVGGAFSGIDVCVSDFYPHDAGGGNAGGGTIEDVAISGGVFALRGDSSQWAMRALRLDGQRNASIHLQDMIWTFGFVDVVASNAPAFMTTKGLDASTTFVSVIDTVLVNISGASAFSLDGRGHPLFLQNVSLAGATPAALVANGTDVWHGTVAAGSPVVRWAGWPGDGGSAVRTNGLFVSGAAIASTAADLPGAPAAPLASLPRPWLDDLPAPPCNARADCDAVGDNVTDDTASLKACLARCPAVFLPWGIYRVSDTLTLSAGAALVGEALSNIFLAPSSPGFGDVRAPKPVLQTPDDAAAAVTLTDLSVIAGAGNAGATLLSWRSGLNSGAWDVNLNVSDNIAYGLHATGAGAGYISNSWVWGADHSIWTMGALMEDHAEIGFLGESAGPLTLFGVACEHHRVAMIELRNASKYDVIVFQSEEATPLVGANATVHIKLGSGTSDSTFYGALSCNWWRPPVLELATADGVGAGVSVFALRNRGGRGPIEQPSSPALNISEADGGWLGLLADVEIPSA